MVNECPERRPAGKRRHRHRQIGTDIIHILSVEGLIVAFRFLVGVPSGSDGVSW